MLNIRWETDYAFLILSYISQQKNLVTISELVREAQVPKQFTATIASKLVKNGILKSKEGKTGGYTLAKDLHSISVYEVVSVFEKDMNIVSCQKDDFVCQLQNACNHKKFFRTKFSTFLTSELKRWSLAEIYDQN